MGSREQHIGPGQQAACPGASASFFHLLYDWKSSEHLLEWWLVFGDRVSVIYASLGCLAKDDLEFLTPPSCWDFRFVPSYLASGPHPRDGP